MPDETTEKLLLSGEERALLEEYFGEPQYAELRELARAANRSATRGGPCVLILPGIMGSKIGKKRDFFFDDVVWIDPLGVIVGGLEQLALPRGDDLEALGVLLFAYLKLKFRLRIAGFDAHFHPFDWRESIDILGDRLLDRIEAEPGKVHLVAHSMGGLVARAALHRDAKRDKVDKLVMLGTPNFGSFAPVEALRGTYGLVRAVAALDLIADADELAETVFKTLPGLHQLLPDPESFRQVDLYQSASWPTGAPVPTQAMLDDALEMRDFFADADDRFYLIAGVDQETTTGLRVENGTFLYEKTNAGDGTVPLAFAELPGAKTWYVNEGHGSLPNNNTVASTVIDLLRSGESNRLPREWSPDRRAAPRVLTEAELRERAAKRALDTNRMSLRERRNLLEPFVSAESRESSLTGGVVETDGASAPTAARARQTFVNQSERPVLEIAAAYGDLTAVKARALVLGLFKEVEPAGAAWAIDNLLDGAIKQFMTRRMFSAEVGDVFNLPTGRHLIHAENVLFAGLGTFDRFTDEVQQFVAQNVAQAFMATHVEDFAGVIVGGNCGGTYERLVYNQLAGYARAIRRAPKEEQRRIRRITLCEIDRDRYEILRETVMNLAVYDDIFGDIMVKLDPHVLPDAPQPARSRRPRVEHDAKLAYLIVNQKRESARRSPTLHASILTAGSGSTVFTGVKPIQNAALEAHLRKIEGDGFTNRDLEAFGKQLAQLTLDDSVIEALHQMRDFHLVVVHDALAGRYPWETIFIKDRFPAASAGMSRRYAADKLSVAKWNQARETEKTLDLLLIVNPTLDLQGTEIEAKAVRDTLHSALSPDMGIQITEIQGASATRETVLGELQSGKYDVVHYAGHAFFDPIEISNSGILCHDEEVLSGSDLAGASDLPALAFFNACESARVRGRRKRGRRKRLDIREQVDRNVGLAEAFMRGGVANYIGTYWPVGDTAAAKFAAAFYRKLVEEKPIGEALQEGRRAVKQARSIDWADYVHYGSYDFVLRQRSREP